MSANLDNRHITISWGAANKGWVYWDIRRCYDKAEMRSLVVLKLNLKTWRQAYNRGWRIVKIHRAESLVS